MKKAGKRITALLIAAIIVFGTAAVGIADFDFINLAYAAESDGINNNETVVTVRIEIVKEPTKLVYTVGDTLDTSGMMLLLINSDGSNKTAIVGYTCNPTKLNTLGTQIITVTYGDFTDTFEVEVVEKPEETTRPTTEPTIPESTTRPEPTTGPTVPESTTRPESTTKPTSPEVTTKPDSNNRFILHIQTKTYELRYEQTAVLTADVSPEIPRGYAVVWSSSNPSVATVNQNGKVAACGDGEAIISATLVDESGKAVVDPHGYEVSDKIVIKCTMTLWQKIVRFFENLFSSIFSFIPASESFKIK